METSARLHNPHSIARSRPLEESLLEIGFERPDTRIRFFQFEVLFATAGTIVEKAELSAIYSLVVGTSLLNRGRESTEESCFSPERSLDSVVK